MSTRRNRRRIAGRATAATLLTAASASLVGAAPAEARAYKVNILRPAPGHVAVEFVEIRLERAARRHGRRLSVRFPRAGSMPPSMKVLYLKRTVRTRRGIRHGVLVIAVNRAAPSATATAAGIGGSPPLITTRPDLRTCDVTPSDQVRLCFDAPAAKAPPPPGAEQGLSREDERAYAYFMSADMAPPPIAQKVGSRLTDLFSGVAGGDNSSPFEDASGKLDPSIETGHYDDGHAFGWGIKTRAVERAADLDALKYLGSGNPAAVLPTLEVFGKVDLNGNGTIDKPGQGQGQTIDTTVGAPQVM